MTGVERSGGGVESSAVQCSGVQWSGEEWRSGMSCKMSRMM